MDALYIFDGASNTLIPVTDNTNYTVTLEDGYYRLEGYSGTGSVTFVLAPEYHTPFWLSAPGIALIILIVLLILVLMFFVGLYVRRKMEATKGEEKVVETEGDIPETEAALVDEEPVPVVDADELEGVVEEEPEAVDARAAVAEAMQDLQDELSAEAFRDVITEIVCGAMKRTMVLPEEEVVEE